MFLARTSKWNETSLMRAFEDHHLLLFRFAYRLTGSADDAEDIVQECFLSLLRPGNGFDPQRGALRSYLLGAVRHHALKRFRIRGSSGGECGDPVDPHDPVGEIFSAEVRTAVAGAIARLPATQKEVLILAHYEQLSLAEIAELLEIEIAAVKSRLQRARATLKQLLAAYAPARMEE